MGDNINASQEKKADSSKGSISALTHEDVQGGTSCTVSPFCDLVSKQCRQRAEHCDLGEILGAESPDCRVQRFSWDSDGDEEAGYSARATSSPSDRTESVDLRLANPLEIFSVTASGHVLGQHIQDAWIELSDHSTSSAPLDHDKLSLVLVPQERGKSEHAVIASSLKRDSRLFSPKCDDQASRDDTAQIFFEYESTAPVLSPPALDSNSLEVALPDKKMFRTPGTEKQGNRAFGDYSENSLRTGHPLRKALQQLSPLMGECDAHLPSVSTYICHDMRKGGLWKNLRPLSGGSRIPPEVTQNKRALSADLLMQRTKGVKSSKLDVLQRSSPAASCNRDGKHVLKVLKASGLSGCRATPENSKTPAQALAGSHPDDLADHDFPFESVKKTSSATPLSEPPAVEQQQPFGRIILMRKKAVIYTAILVVLALTLGVSASYLHNKFVNAHSTQFPAARASKSLLLAGNGSFVGPDAIKEDYDTCSTTACRLDGAYLKGLLSWDLDPCDNFYRFVCSRWKGGGGVVKGITAAAASDELSHQLEQSVHVLIQRSSSPEDFAPLKALFYECMNTRQLDLDDWNPMLELLWLVSLEGFPFSSTPRNSTSLWKIAAKVLKMTGAEALLSMRAVAHPTKGDTGILSVGVPTMLAPKGSDQAHATQFYNSTAFACITALKKQRNPTVYSLEVAAFASRLEMLVYTFTVLAGLPSGRIKPIKTQPELSAFLVQVFLNSDSSLYSGSHTELHIQSPAFFEALITLVRNTEQYIVMNYLGVRLMIEVAAFAPSSGRPLVHTLVHHLYGRPRPLLPRWRLCIRAAEKALPDLFLHAGKLAFKTHYALDMVQRLLEALRHQLLHSLSKLAILDRDSGARAQALLNSTRFRLFRPAWLSNHEKLEGYMSALPRVVRGQSLRSFYTLHSHSFTESLRRDEADRWQGSAFDHDCTFDGNVVYVPVLLFNFTLFSYDADQSLQLPNSGVRIVRCLLQLLLNSVNSGGSVSPVASRVWWPDMSSSLLAVAQLCLQQYGVRQLGPLELLQHTAALKPAMDLFQEQRRIDVRFETFQTYSVFHLFFVYYALALCEDNSADNTVASFLTNVPLWNNRLFQETFRCPVGSNMNPSRKCIVWRETH
ncbi:hypothetical protein V5799_026732 [Amblyomma americanum]|uniref:Peptidase M13 N-terminal domain-containing protein n=1 Tax=Amblyomma americanum TaxID=6943 RepID=A0AAQ4DHR0_AMBAM